MNPRPMLLATTAALCALAGVARAEEMFQPEAALTPERRKDHYALRVTTRVPSACYRTGPVQLGPPASVRLTADTVAVRVALQVRRGPCAQMVTTVRHQHRGLRLGGKTGKARVMVFAMLDGKVVGSTSVDAPTRPPPDQRPPPATVTIATSDWYAWVNRMPPGPASFHVTGTVSLPTPGYDAKLVYASPQGINPKELILDLVVTPKAGVFPQVVTKVTVRFDRTDTAYDGVLIRKTDGDTHIDVEEVH